MTRPTICALILACLVGIGTFSSAQQQHSLFEYQVSNKVQSDQGKPFIELRARDFITGGTITFERDGNRQRHNIGSMRPAATKRFHFEQPKGTFQYKVTIDATSQTEDTLNTSFDVEVSWVDPIELSVDPERVQVAEGKLQLRSNRPLARVEIEVFDKDGQSIQTRTQTTGGQHGALEIQWNPTRQEVGAIQLKAHDVDGFWNAVVLEPFWVEIPHETVIFDFGKATFQDSEVPKLQKTLADIRNAMERYQRHGLQLRLYVAGYTDTVGSAEANRRLSQERARAIARWFRSNGLTIQIYYQGFGQEVLAVETPDNTPEERNRRAVYILGNAPPPTSGQVPRANWQRL